MSNEINIVIADEQEALRNDLHQLLESDPSFNVIGEAPDGKAALDLIDETKPDVVVLAADLPLSGGFELARMIFSRSLPVEVILLTDDKSESGLAAAIDVGVRGYILKNDRSTYLIDAVKTLCDGNSFISPAFSNLLIEEAQENNPFLEDTTAVSKLTPAEKRVLLLISGYMTNKEIAGELGVSIRTVERHRAHIASKLDLHGKNSLFKFAADHQHELT